MIKIFRNGVHTNSGPDQEWLQRHIAMGSFGKNAESHLELVSPATHAEDGSELTPDVYQEVWTPAEYAIEEVDDSIKSQEQINQEAREYLASSDWMVVRLVECGTPIPEEVVTARATARTRII